MAAAVGAVAVTVAMAFGAAAAGRHGQPGTDQALTANGARELTDQEFDTAVAIARQKAADQAPHVTLATATADEGTESESNTGSSCTSGRLLHITLFGTFNIVTGGLANHANQGAVTTLDITADASTGQPCLIGVETGKATPDPSATILFGTTRSRSR